MAGGATHGGLRFKDRASKLDREHRGDGPGNENGHADHGGLRGDTEADKEQKGADSDQMDGGFERGVLHFAGGLERLR